MNIKNNTILITGGSSGIGRSVAIKLHELGNQVIVCARSKDKLSELQKTYPGMIVYTCDLSKKTEISKLIKLIVKNHPTLNILINNAGILSPVSITDKDFLENTNLEFNVNFYAPITLINQLFHILKKQKQSAIINIGSLVSYAPLKSKPGYCASKAALHSFTKSLRFLLKNTNIQVFEVFPPAVQTNMAKHLGESAKFRILSPEYVSDIIILGIKANKYEIRIGITKLFYILYRFFPRIIDLKLSRS